MGSRRFLSWPAGWRKSLPWGFLLGVIVAALLIVAQTMTSVLTSSPAATAPRASPASSSAATARGFS